MDVCFLYHHCPVAGKTEDGLLSIVWWHSFPSRVCCLDRVRRAGRQPRITGHSHYYFTRRWCRGECCAEFPLAFFLPSSLQIPHSWRLGEAPYNVSPCSEFENGLFIQSSWSPPCSDETNLSPYRRGLSYARKCALRPSCPHSNAYN